MKKKPNGTCTFHRVRDDVVGQETCWSSITTASPQHHHIHMTMCTSTQARQHCLKMTKTRGSFQANRTMTQIFGVLCGYTINRFALAAAPPACETLYGAALQRYCREMGLGTVSWEAANMYRDDSSHMNGHTPTDGCKACSCSGGRCGRCSNHCC